MGSNYGRALALVKIFTLRKMVVAALFLFILVLVILYTMSRNTARKTSSQWRSSDKISSQRLHSSRKRVMLLNGTALQEDWLLAAVDKLPFKTMTPSFLLLEDLYFTPNYNIQEDYSNRVLKEPKSSCTNSPQLLILVPSEPKSSSLRKAIRETWGSVGRGKKAWPWRIFNMQICLLFVLGIEGPSLESNKFVHNHMLDSGGAEKVETGLKSEMKPNVDYNKVKLGEYDTKNSEKHKRAAENFLTANQVTSSILQFQSKRYFEKENVEVKNTSFSKNIRNMNAFGKSRDHHIGLLKRIQRSSESSEIMIAKAKRTVQESNVQLISHEWNTLNDILQFDMVDSYNNLTRKLLLAMQWVTKNIQDVKYIIKADQDVFVNIPLIATFLKNYGEENAVYGSIYANSWVERTGRWAVPDTIVPIPKYPIYAAGNAYILSGDAMAKVLNMSVHFPYVPVEDAFITGILASVCGVNRVNVAGFTRWTDSQPDSCDFVNDKRYVGNSYTEHSFRITWSDLIDRGSERCEN